MDKLKTVPDFYFCIQCWFLSIFKQPRHFKSMLLVHLSLDITAHIIMKIGRMCAINLTWAGEVMTPVSRLQAGDTQAHGGALTQGKAIVALHHHLICIVVHHLTAIGWYHVLKYCQVTSLLWNRQSKSFLYSIFKDNIYYYMPKVARL